MASPLRPAPALPPAGASPAAVPPTRVLIIECNDDGTVGGSHQALLDLVRFVDRRRWEPVVLFYEDNPFADRVRALGVEVVDWEGVHRAEYDLMLRSARPRKLLGMAQAVARRWRFLRERGIGLVHMNNSPYTGNDDWLPAARLAGIPIVASAMQTLGETRWLKRRLYRAFDLVMPVSAYVRGVMRDFGVPEGRMVTINHGVDVAGIRARVRRPRAEVRRELGIPDDALMVAMVGNVRRWKGQHVVLSALAGLAAAERERLRVAFVGAVSRMDPDDAAFAAELRETVAREGLEGCTQFTGARRDVPDLMTAADVVLHASVTPEPGGIVVLEGMALGRAVVAASRGGHTEYLTPESGVMFDTDQPGQLTAILRGFLEEPGRCVRMGRAAAERVTAFSMERNAADTGAAYDRALAGRR